MNERKKKLVNELLKLLVLNTKLFNKTVLDNVTVS